MTRIRGFKPAPYEITTREEYEKLKARGYDTLFWNDSLQLAPALRVEIQQEIFGKGNHQKSNQKFYRLAWNRKDTHKCEECMRPLPEYSATFISHMLSRGAHPEAAYDLRNYNILCPDCHHRWENGDRENMKIWQRNNCRMKKILKDYEKVKRQNFDAPVGQ